MPSKDSIVIRQGMLETDGFNQLVRSRDGYALFNVHDIYIGQAIQKYGEYSGLEMQLLDQLLRPSDIAIEVGANIGAHTVAIAQKVGRQGRVLAFEPQRLAFQTLCANMALNSLTNAECYWSAVGASHGKLFVPELDPNQDNNFGGLSLRETTRGMQIPCVMLDDFESLPRLRLIKIDVEGMELDVLRGGTKLISKHKPYLYVENDRMDSSEELIRMIDSLGYTSYWHKPWLYNKDNYYGETENIYPNVISLNMLCVHKDSNTVLQGIEPITDFTQHPMRKQN